MTNKKRIFAILGILLVFAVVVVCFLFINKEPTTTEVSQITEPIMAYIDFRDDEIRVNEELITQDSTNSVYLSNDIIYRIKGMEASLGHGYIKGKMSDTQNVEEVQSIKVINITSPGVYQLTGNLLDGQINVDLGQSAKNNPEAKVVLILDNATVRCHTAPAIVFQNVYEFDKTAVFENNGYNEERNEIKIPGEQFGAQIILAEGSFNQLYGAGITVNLEDDGSDNAAHKMDGTINSNTSLYIAGKDEAAVLQISAENEGISTQKHLLIENGAYFINSNDDAINANADNISIIEVKDANIYACGGEGEDEDALDSNGYINIESGIVLLTSGDELSAGLDADIAARINGGTVISFGSTHDWPSAKSEQTVINLEIRKSDRVIDGFMLTDANDKPLIALNFNEGIGEFIAGRYAEYSAISISSPLLKQGETYHIYLGTKMEGESYIAKAMGEEPNIIDRGTQYAFSNYRVSNFKEEIEAPDLKPEFEGDRFKKKTYPDFKLYGTINNFGGLEPVRSK